jgi:hypothetical protein
MEPSKEEEAFYSLKYFWNEKGDMESYCDFEASIKLFPLLEKAWKDYKLAIQMIDCILENGWKGVNNG